MNRAGSPRLIAVLTCLAAAACARTAPATRAGGDLAAPAASSPTESAALGPLPAVLADGGAVGYRLRVLLTRHHRARVDPRAGGPWSEADEAGLNGFAPPVSGPYPYVVIEPGTWPRVLSEYEGVRLLLYVDPADAQPVAVRTTRLRPRADQPAGGDVGVTIYPGLPVAANKSGGERRSASRTLPCTPKAGSMRPTSESSMNRSWRRHGASGRYCCRRARRC